MAAIGVAEAQFPEKYTGRGKKHAHFDERKFLHWFIVAKEEKQQELTS
jgi:hypothetical protein